jgi:hypothetical protein
MENNNDSIELQSNFKHARVEVDLANSPIDPYLRKKKIMIIILMIETNLKKIFTKKKKKELSNQLTMIFQKQNLEKHGVILIQHGSKNMIGWNNNLVSLNYLLQ